MRDSNGDSAGATTTKTPAPANYLPSSVRRGLALSLSGGGFRATLFHLGALRRLNELGVLSSIDTVTSVSGGSIMAACLADTMLAAPPQRGSPLSNFQALVDKVHDVTSYNLRRTILLKKVIPTNWGKSMAHLVAKEIESRVTGKSLADLPVSPRFVFCATDMAFGVDWEYSRDRAGDYRAGYKTKQLGDIPIAHAAAASACFPPVFEPIEPLVQPNEYAGGEARGGDADRCRQLLRLTDGGVYDNMGLEPVWKVAATLLVSDAGGPFDYSAARGPVADLQRYPDIMGSQAHALRQRWLLASFDSASGPARAGLEGTYWSCAGNRRRYQDTDSVGYSADTSTLIAHIRTDLNAFSEGEAAILENHGYLMADIALKVYQPKLYTPTPAPQPPYPAWMDEAKVKEALKNSSKRSW